jgi:hypothetical protein
MTNIYTILQLHKLTGFSRITTKRYLEKDKNFKKIIVKNQIKYKSKLDFNTILELFEQKKKENYKKK